MTNLTKMYILLNSTTDISGREAIRDQISTIQTFRIFLFVTVIIFIALTLDIW